MDHSKRRTLLALLALPAGCTIEPLSPLATSVGDGKLSNSPIRPPAIGQTWRYKKFNFYNSQLLDTVQERLSAIEAQRLNIERQSAQGVQLASEIHSHWGLVKQDPYWDNLQTYDEPLAIWPTDLSLGVTQSINTNYQSDQSSFKHWINVQTRVMAQERIALSCGTFETFKIEKLIRLDAPDGLKTNLFRQDTIWFAPQVGRWVVRETNGQFVKASRKSSLAYEDHFRWELESWS